MRKVLFVITLFFLCKGHGYAQAAAYDVELGVLPLHYLVGGNSITQIQSDDSTSDAIPIGFSFFWDGNLYDSLKVNSNGWVSFDTNFGILSPTLQTNNSLKNSLGFRPIIAPLWDDLNGDAGTASYLTIGTAPNRTFVLEWKNWKWPSTAILPTLSFQLLLSESTNLVKFRYKLENSNSLAKSASIGISDSTSGTGAFYSIGELSNQAYGSSTTEYDTISGIRLSKVSLVFKSCKTTINITDTFCVNDTALILNQGIGFPTGGTDLYRIDEIVSTKLDPERLGPGDHELEYIYNTSTCSDTFLLPLFVHKLPKVNLNFPSVVCSNQDSIRLAGRPRNGLYFGNGFSSDTNYVLLDSLRNLFFHNLKYTYTDTNGCTGADSIVFRLDTLTESSFALVDSACKSTDSVRIRAGMPGGGSYFGNNVLGSYYFPRRLGVDSVFYHYTATNGCSDTSMRTIRVDSITPVVLSNVPQLCDNDTPFVLEIALPTGGVYFGKNVSSNRYTPTSFGNDTIAYSYTNYFGCTNTETTIFLVDQSPKVSLSAFNSLCNNSPVFKLTHGNPKGGIYTGSGVTDSLFDASRSGIGFDTLSYIYTSNNSCKDTAFEVISIFEKPMVSFSTVSSVCQNDDSLLLSGGLPLNGTYKGKAVSSASGRFFLQPQKSFGVFTRVKYQYTTLDGCVDSVIRQIEIIENPKLFLGLDLFICGADSGVLDAGIDSAIYSWSTGQTERKIKIQESAIFRVTVTDTTNLKQCKTEDEIRVDYDAICLGINKLDADRSVVVFPNPVPNNLNILRDDLNSVESVSVYSIIGELIETLEVSKLKPGEFSVDISNLPKGQYFIRIKSNIDIISVPIIKE